MRAGAGGGSKAGAAVGCRSRAECIGVEASEILEIWVSLVRAGRRARRGGRRSARGPDAGGTGV
eukprot:2236855-Rhodomonas_salina.1